MIINFLLSTKILIIFDYVILESIYRFDTIELIVQLIYNATNFRINKIDRKIYLELIELNLMNQH